MGAKHLVCNDCGCKFQIHDSGKGQASQKKDVGREKAKPIKICCPECQSYKVTTA